MRRFYLALALLLSSLPAAAQNRSFTDFIESAPTATTPFSDSDTIPVIQGGVTRKTSPESLINNSAMNPEASNATLPTATQNLGLTTVYAKQYGVRADRVVVTSDISVSSGATAATTIVASFTAADVGKIIIIYGAGASGNALSTTIAAVGGTHSITLAAAASTTVANASFEYATNDAANINAARAAGAIAYPGGFRLILPAGGYIMKPSLGQVTLASNMILDGQGAVAIRCDDTANAAAAADNACIYGNDVSNVTITDLAVQGMADVTPTINPTLSAPVYLLNSDNIKITGNTITYSRSNGINVWGHSTNVSATLNRLSYLQTSGIDVAGAEVATVSFNQIDHCSDNAIAAGLGNTNPPPGRPVTITSVGNMITECWAVAFAGAHNITFSHNVMRRMIYYGIFIAPFTSFDNGDEPHVGVTVVGNTILDVLSPTLPGVSEPANQAYLVINGGQRQAGTGASIPGTPVVGTGVVTSLYGTDTGNYWVTGTDTATVPSPGGAGWTIADNVFMRTLPAVAAYSDWGVGASLWSGARGSGGPYTGAIVEADLNVDCIRITGPLRNAKIHHNTCNTTGANGIYELFATDAAGDFDGLEITDNSIIDFSANGIAFSGTSYSQVVVKGNTINGDPRFVSANRGAGGTWLANNPVVGIFSALDGVSIDRNEFRNVANPIGTSGGAGIVYVGPDNVIYGQPAADGFSTSNVGVGQVNGATGVNAIFRSVCEDGDPASATYGKITTAQGRAYTAMPAAGCWVKGTFVANASPTQAVNGRVPLGWMRLTTGSANVDGTDWQTVYSFPLKVLTNTKTSDYPVLTTDSSKHFNNSGASGTVIFSLPAAADGLQYCFAVYTAQILRVLANGTNVISVAASSSVAGGNIEANAQFASICLEAHGTGRWIAVATPDATQWTVN